MRSLETRLCEDCQKLAGAGGGKQPHARLVPLDKYRARAPRTATTMDFVCSVCGVEWRYHRKAGWDRLGT